VTGVRGGLTVAALVPGRDAWAGLIQASRSRTASLPGGAFDWATPFAALCGLGVVAGYALLGATWLAMKTDGEIAARARAHAKCCAGRMAFMALVSLWSRSPFRAFSRAGSRLPNILFLWPVQIVTALTAFRRGNGWSKEAAPSVLRRHPLFLLGYLGLGHLDLSLSGAADAHHLGHAAALLADFPLLIEPHLLPIILF